MSLNFLKKIMGTTIMQIQAKSTCKAMRNFSALQSVFFVVR